MTGHMDIDGFVFSKLDMIQVTVQIHLNKIKMLPVHMLQQVCKMNEHVHL